MTGIAKADASRPPKPKLCLRVGVTGHRTLGNSTNAARIEREIASVLSTIAEETASVFNAWRAYFDGDAAILRLVSALAEGADCVAGQIALDQGYALHAPLPFPAERYRNDFDEEKVALFDALMKKAEAFFELDNKGVSDDERAAAYLECGRITLAQSDILIAVWDGSPARGIGGTAMIVEEALRASMPVIWIHATDDISPCFMRDEFGRGGGIGETKAMLSRLLAPPFQEEEIVAELGAANKAALEKFLNETEKRFNFGMVFGALETLLVGKAPRFPALKLPSYADKTAKDWAPYFEAAGAISGKASEPLHRVLAPRFSWADNLATFYAKLYRSSYTMNYLLSAFAVALALGEVLLGYGKEFFIATELVAILSILGLTIAGRRQGWHEKWIDYRQLSEQLRHIRFLYLTGGQSSDAGERHEYGHGGAHGSWVEWYLEATRRELGLAPITIDNENIRRVRKAFVDLELEDQCGYHRSNISRMEKIEHALHRAGDYFFGATLAACVAYLSVYGLTKIPATCEWATDLKYEIKDWVTFLTAFLPAVGAAMLGVRMQGEFASTAERSEAMAERLGELAKELHKVEHDDLTLSVLRAYVESGAETMLIEVADWRFVFRGKPLSLPA